MKKPKREPRLRLTPLGQGLLGGLFGGLVVGLILATRAEPRVELEAPTKASREPYVARSTRRMGLSLTPAYTASDPEPAPVDNPWSVGNASDEMVSAAYELRELREALT